MRQSSQLGRWAITGAGGQVGRVLRDGLRDEVTELRLLDVCALSPESPRESVRVVDVCDGPAMAAALSGIDGIVHLAAIADEAGIDELLQTNVLGSYQVLEAARRCGTPRVILASTNHVTGMYPAGDAIDEDAPVRPDSLYGVTKVSTEALGRLYADKFGIEVACLRIGSCLPAPTEPRHRHTWLSYRDAVAAFRAAMQADDLSFSTFYAVSANQKGWWSSPTGAMLGYQPQDDADQHFARAGSGYTGLQGGPFTSPEYGRSPYPPPWGDLSNGVKPHPTSLKETQ